MEEIHMNKHFKILSGLLLLLAVLLCGCSSKSSQLPALTDPSTGTVSEPPTQSASSSGEEPAPIYITFEGTDLEGNSVSQDVFLQSRPTMVNVWATYCNPCLNEMPGLGELAVEYDHSNFQIIGIVSDVREGAYLGGVVGAAEKSQWEELIHGLLEES